MHEQIRDLRQPRLELGVGMQMERGAAWGDGDQALAGSCIPGDEWWRQRSGGERRNQMDGWVDDVPHDLIPQLTRGKTGRKKTMQADSVAWPLGGMRSDWVVCRFGLGYEILFHTQGIEYKYARMIGCVLLWILTNARCREVRKRSMTIMCFSSTVCFSHTVVI
jgi:hypothetical protein